MPDVVISCSRPLRKRAPSCGQTVEVSAGISVLVQRERLLVAAAPKPPRSPHLGCAEGLQSIGPCMTGLGIDVAHPGRHQLSLRGPRPWQVVESAKCVLCAARSGSVCGGGDAIVLWSERGSASCR
eukprot:4092291-Amphidinium_carterae.4